MIELKNKKERKKYINDLCKKLFNQTITDDKISFIEVGVMNYVYKVKISKKKNIYFKQALKKAKKDESIGKDLASINYKRIKFEKNVIEIINSLKLKQIVPTILNYDEENNILCLSDVGTPSSRLLEKSLLNNTFKPNSAKQIGQFLGRIHSKTKNKELVIRTNKKEDLKNWKVFLNMRTKGITKEGETGKILKEIYYKVLKSHTYDVLTIMDCCPKNIIERDDGKLGFIDFELSSGLGDPAYDIGFVLGHYILFSIIKKNKNSLKCIKNIIDEYLKVNKKFENMLERIIIYTGAVLLYRLKGSSPAKYIPKEKIKQITLIGEEMIKQVRNKEELLKIVEVNLK